MTSKRQTYAEQTASTSTQTVRLHKALTRLARQWEKAGKRQPRGVQR